MARKSRKNPAPAADMRTYEQSTYDVGGYVRLSAVDRKQKGDSIETQQAIISAYMAECPELILREIYIDNGTSGTTFERKAFQRMLADAESGKINCLITKDLSRLGRNAIDTGYYIDKYFPAQGLRFIAINDGYDSADNESGGMMVSLKNMINETYALEIGRKIRSTKQMNIRQGAFVGRFPPYGFLKNPEDNHQLVADENTAPVIRTVFEMAANGSNVIEISRHLNDTGILPPKRYFHSIGLATDKEANGHPHWNKGTVYGILHNRVYLGDMVQGKYRTTNHIEEKLPQSQWIITENTHEALVSREIWEKVQKRWGNAPKRKRGSCSENPFLRKIFCARCGYSMRRTRYSRTYGFTCETRFYYNADDCVAVSINENDLKEKLLAELRKYTSEIAGILSPAQPANTESTELKEIRQQLDKNKDFLKGLYESLVLGDVTDGEYRDMKQSYEMRIASLTEQEQQLYESISQRIANGTKRKKAADSAGAIRTAADLTAEVIDALVERIDVSEDKSIKVTFKFLDNSMKEKEDGCDG